MNLKPQDLGRAVKQLQSLNHRRLEVGLREIGATLAQWDALRAINDIPGASAHALAEETFQTDQAFGTLSGRMIEKGFVDRRPGKGRAFVHTLTPKGERALEQGSAVAGRVIEGSFANLSELERADLFRLVQKALSTHVPETFDEKPADEDRV